MRLVDKRDVERHGPRDGFDWRPALLFGLVAAVPTLVAAARGPEHLLDDIEFAAAARFSGFDGFVWEMRYRPGQGLIHAAQFLLLRGHASTLLVVLAVAQAAVAALFFRLVERVTDRWLAVAASVVFVSLPNRGSLRFWASTLPNHVALIALLAGCLVVARAHDRGRVERRDWFWLILAVTASVATYEGTVVIAAAAVAALAGVSWRTDRRQGLTGLRPSRLIGPTLGGAALVGLLGLHQVGRPEGFRPTLFAGRGTVTGVHLASLAGSATPALGALLMGASIAAALVVLVGRSDDPGLQRAARLSLVGVGVIVGGLAPFVAGGFNVQASGVLDRCHFLAAFGDALLIGGAATIVGRSLGAAGLVVRGGAITLAAALVAVGTVGVFADLAPYERAADDLRRADAELLAIEPIDLDASTGTRVHVDRPPTDGGVAWGFFVVQLRDRWQLLHDDPAVPEWLEFDA